MLIIFEDPAKKRSDRERATEQSKARIHAAKVGYYARQRHDPSARILSPIPRSELRCLAYYRERTSVEWSGWGDHLFWTVTALRIASNHPVLQDSLIALALYHEGLETDSHELQRLSVTQAKKNIAWVNEHYDSVPRDALIAFCVVATQLSGLMSHMTFLQSLRMQSALIDSKRVDGCELDPLCRRILSHQCQIIDPVPVLREAFLPVPPPGCPLTQCKSLAQARESLENSLNMVASPVKSGMQGDYALLEEWLVNFTRLRDTCHRPSWLALKAAYGMSIIQIEVINNNDETIYDQYLDVFADVANAYEAMLASQRQGNLYRFNIDAGFLSLVGWAAKWCRHPPLRSRLIRLLLQARRIEGNHGSDAWAMASETLKNIEEYGIEPPPVSCAEIPEWRRVRLQSVIFYRNVRVMCMEILRYPYSDPCESLWLPLTPPQEHIRLEDELAKIQQQTHPEWIMGSAYFGFSKSDDPSDWYTMRSPDFFFVIPRL